MLISSIGLHFRGPYRDAHIEGAYISAIKKGDRVRASLIQFIQLLSMTTSKDSQFLEVCKKPILTPLRSLIKTESKLGRITFPLKLSRLGL